ncbi:MAG: PIN domain-containing protein [Chloroflexota bacterium]
MSVEFCDTNVIVYAYDRSAGAKHTQARLLMDRLWESQTGALSVQIMQEAYVTLTRKLQPPYSMVDARQIIADLATWRSVVEPTRQDVLDAIDGGVRWGISYWDALALTAARRAGAAVVWSEDLNAGQSYDGIAVRSPFASPR